MASLEDAICAILFNTTIQSVVVRSNFQIQSPNGHGQPSFHSSPYLNKYGYVLPPLRGSVAHAQTQTARWADRFGLAQTNAVPWARTSIR